MNPFSRLLGSDQYSKPKVCHVGKIIMVKKKKKRNVRTEGFEVISSVSLKHITWSPSQTRNSLLPIKKTKTNSNQHATNTHIKRKKKIKNSQRTPSISIRSRTRHIPIHPHTRPIPIFEIFRKRRKLRTL